MRGRGFAVGVRGHGSGEGERPGEDGVGYRSPFSWLASPWRGLKIRVALYLSPTSSSQSQLGDLLDPPWNNDAERKLKLQSGHQGSFA